MINDFEMVIGLEVHIELDTKTKIFCDCKTDFGAEPNTQTCPVCLGMPGTLPVLNKKVVEYAIMAGVATNCKIAKFSKQDRKNYAYPDLPKAYQISQFDLPLCEHGNLEIATEKGTKKVGITRIHIEEDAGKLVHDDEKGTLIDCNRCGVPLVEIVSEPDIRSSEEAIQYLKKLRAIVMYTGASNCKMNEGSMRCDVNLSVRKKGATEFGIRTEMKNLNSFAFIQKAIDFEFKRQVELLEAGEEVIQETRRYDQSTGKTFSMRKKEDADDYRYFPDPDLLPIITSDEKLEELTSLIPMLPDERKDLYIQNYGLTNYDAQIITGDKLLADFFEECAEHTKYKKILANLIIADVIKLADENEKIDIQASSLAAIAELAGDGVINSSVSKKVIKDMWGKEVQNVVEYVKENDLAQINDKAMLTELVLEVIQNNPKSVSDYKNGKTAAIKSLVGQIMAKTGGKANPILTNELLENELK